MAIRTIGHHVCQWAEEYLAWSAGEPLRLTPDQIRFILAFYATDEAGQRLTRTRAVYSRPKGAGKSPLGSILCAAEAWGPCLADGLDSDGIPVGRPRAAAEVLIFATAEGQAGNVYDPLCDLLLNGPAFEAYQLDIGLSRIVDPLGAAIYPLSSGSISKDGRRTDFALFDETHLMYKANTKDLASVMRRNLAKRGGRSVEVTTAWRPGQKSVAELSWEYAEAVKDGRLPDQGLLFDMRSGPAPLDWSNDDELRACLSVAYAGCGDWIDVDRLVTEARDPNVPRSDVERYFLNRIVASEDQYVDPDRWARCHVPSSRPALGATITAGFDGAWTDDATAIVGVEVESGTAFLIGLWEHPPGPEPWEIDQREVDALVAQMMRDFRVERFYCDPFRWQDWLASWQDTYGDGVRAWYTHRDRQMFTALERLRDSINNGTIQHCGDSGLARHVGNAQKRPTRTGYTIQKPTGNDGAKIDAAVALVLAWEARADLLASGYSRSKRAAAARPAGTLVSF